jgi:hypothetical protein
MANSIKYAIRSVHRALSRKARTCLASKLTFRHDTLMMQYRVTCDPSKRKEADLIIEDLRALHEGTASVRSINVKYKDTDSTNQLL